MPSIETVLNALANNHRVVSHVPHACLHARNAKSRCTRCMDVCPADALSIVENRLVLDYGKCSGCGSCCGTCPTGALVALVPTDEQLFAECMAVAEQNEGEAVIACNHFLQGATGLYDREKVVDLLSLSRVEESLLIRLAIKPEINRITLVSAGCENCEMPLCRNLVKRTCATVYGLITAWGIQCEIRLSDRLPGKVKLPENPEYDKDRRNFFSTVRKETRLAASATIQASLSNSPIPDDEEKTYLRVDKNGLLPQNFPANRKALLETLDTCSKPKPLMLNTHLWGAVTINTELCNGCRICPTFCPTGALFKFHTEKGKSGIKHRPRQCIACGCCEEVCPRHAISLSTKVFSVEIADSAVHRFELPAFDSKHAGESKSMMYAMRELLGTDLIGER